MEALKSSTKTLRGVRKAQHADIVGFKRTSLGKRISSTTSMLSVCWKKDPKLTHEHDVSSPIESTNQHSSKSCALWIGCNNSKVMKVCHTGHDRIEAW